jgi:hypothetical protein
MASRSPLEPSKASRSAKGAAFRALRSRRSDPPAGAPRKGSVAKHEIYGIPRTKLSTRSSARKISGAFFRSFCFVDFFSRRPSAEVKRQIQNELRTSLTNEGIVRTPKGVQHCSDSSAIRGKIGYIPRAECKSRFESLQPTSRARGCRLRPARRRSRD